MAAKPPQSPDEARKFAAGFVKSQQELQVILDYSPPSLEKVDRQLHGYHIVRAMGLEDADTTESVTRDAYGAGCYLGEVIIRNHGGHWRRFEGTSWEQFDGMSRFPVLIEMPRGLICNALGKAFKLLDNGMEDSLAGFYQAVTQADRSSVAAESS